MLTAKQIEQQYKTFRDQINTLFPTRQVELNAMYDYYEDRIIMMPASGIEHYHNAFPGGYIDHVMRVMDYSLDEMNLWKKRGLKVDNFSQEELLFSAAHHDLGKVGMPGNYEQYKPNPSEWHRTNQGHLFVHDSTHPFMLVPDLSIYILQHFGVKMSWQEMLTIRTHDGIYDRANEAYYFAKGLDSKSRTNINQIVHNADMAAARFEFERWAIANPTKFKFYNDKQVEKKRLTQAEIDKLFDI